MSRFKFNFSGVIGTLIMVLPLIGLFAVPVMAESISKINLGVKNEQIKKWNDELLTRISIAPELGDFKTLQDKTLRVPAGWTWRDGVICVTNSVSTIAGIKVDHGHAGIIAAEPYYYATIEANRDKGVHVAYGDWMQKYTGTIWQVGVNSTSVQEDHLAAVSAAEHLHKKYKFPVMLDNRNEFYCSHLVYAAYKDATGVDLAVGKIPGLILPYDLLNPDIVSLIYKNR